VTSFVPEHSETNHATHTTHQTHIKRAEKHCHRLPKEVVESPSLEVSKNCMDVAMRNMVSGHGGNGLVVGLDDLSSFFQP